MSIAYVFDYNDNENILITTKTVDYGNSSFKKNTVIWEKESLSYFFNLIDKNKKVNIVDIGANVGLYSLYAKHLPNSQFYSYEPFNFTYNLLNDNIKLNNISNIKTYNIGLSDNKGKTILNVCLSQDGLNTMGKIPLRFNDINPVEVEIDTLDNIFYNNNIAVDFIKIDTEGYEYYILKGGEKTIKKYKPTIQLEFCVTNMHQCNITPKQLHNYITELGYTIHNLIGEELIIVPNNSL